MTPATAATIFNRPNSTPAPPLHFPLGTVISGPKPAQFLFSEQALRHHACVLGATGSGKSKFLELLMRYLIVHGRDDGGGPSGFCLIDPHGDLSEDVLAFLRFQAVVRNRPHLMARVHYLEPSYEQVFHYDPFKYPKLDGLDPELRVNKLKAWLHAKADRIGEIVQRKQGDTSFEGMAKLQRVLTNLLVAVGTAVYTKNGRPHHLPLADALVLLNREHPRYEDVYRRVLPKLDNDARSLFTRFNATRSQQLYMGETESTLNRFHSLLSPVVKGIFADQTHTIDFESIVQNGDILLVNLRQTDTFSADQGNAIGGMFIHELLSTAQNADRRNRKRFHLIVDEAADFIGGDIRHALGVMRKFQMSMVFGAQDLSSFVKGDLDLRPKVLSQCGTKVVFRQDWPEDLDILAKVMGMGNLDFAKHYQTADRPDGYDFMPMTDYARNFTWGENWTNGFAVTNAEGRTVTASAGATGSRNWSRGDTASESESDGQTDGGAVVTNWGRSASETRVGDEVTSTGAGTNAGGSETRQTATVSGRARAHAITRTDGGAAGWSRGHAEALARSFAESASRGVGGSQGGGVTASEKTIHLARHREERHESPSLLNAVADQFWRMQADIACLGQAQCVVKLLGQKESFVTQVAFVPEHWVGDDKFVEIDIAKRQIAAQHAYFSVPQLDAEGQNRRIDEYVYGKGDIAEPDSAAAVTTSAPAPPHRSNGRANGTPKSPAPFAD